MPKFDSREEYERWKAEQLGKGREKGSSEKAPEEQPEETEKKVPVTDEKGPEGPRPAAGGTGKGGDGLPDVGDLFGRAWETFKARFGILIGLFLFPLVLCGIIIGIFAGGAFLLALTLPGQKAVFISLAAITGGVAAAWVLFWGGASLISAVVDEQLGFGEALARGKGRVCSFVWISVLMGFIITGGFLLFFVPGILFSVWFAFPLYIMAREDVRGMDALLKSREYVRDMWFPVFLRLVLIYMLSAVVGAIPLLGILLSIAGVPYMMIYVNYLYQDLASLKGSLSYASSGGRKCGWIALSGLGYIVAPIVIIALVGASLLGTLMLFTGLVSSNPEKFAELLRQGIMSEGPAAPASEIEGVWHAAQGEQGRYEWRITGKDFEITARRGADLNRMKGRLVIRKDVEPKEVDILITEATNAEYLGKTALGIYQTAYDVLTICSSEPGSPERPRSFSEAGNGKCFYLVRGPAPSAGAEKSMPPEGVTPAPPAAGMGQQAPAGQGERVWVYVYALNYSGIVRLNGKQICEIRGEEDTNYNYTVNEHVPAGPNVIDVEYQALPRRGEITLRVSGGGVAGGDRLLGEWKLDDKGGRRQFTFEVTK